MNKNDRNVLEPIAVQRITSHNEVRHPLHMASMNGHLGSVQLLIQLGADVNCRDGQGRTAAHLAIMRGHQHILELLLCHGFKSCSCRQGWQYSIIPSGVYWPEPGHCATVRVGSSA